MKSCLFHIRETLPQSGGSETEGGGDDRPPHMHIETKAAFASRNIEIEAAVAEVQVRRWTERVVDGAEDLPISMRADPKAADITIRRQREAVAEVTVIARADQRVGPDGAAARGRPSEQAGIEL